ncbi:MULTISPECIES: NAD(P)/FAD-dependent oxidoreductase [unclassified Streptomyces]|uniref:type III sulfide quinone reductase, selenoprotein subtype n=1 Tax=unclassified Streptomyces TaxID=2593676 RepID=UPI001F042638|nr:MULTISPECIES: FAD/NAD(P)-binding oxidoreductase [unclassified Streptomyces]MCH0561817.1 NAD(P)/FAD-dependent oxidoreductase [Streptomyces sp. MUM 2J]MCH0568870.1 NAD(P)/FAD-dependent oxidoreductase [Streptomyces sp. MUM 136J]
MGKHIVILGGGTAGTMTANRLCRTYGRRECRITVVDQDDDHLYQPGLLFVPFGLAQPDHLVRPRPRQLDAAADYKQARIERVDLDARTVHLAGGIRLPYDVLVVATGARLLPEETEGLTGPGWGEKVFTFYDLPGAVGLHQALERFEGGRLVIDVADLPLKCPVAPLEFAFLADWYLQRRGIRDRVELTYATPLDAAFTKPVAAKALGGLLKEKGVDLVTEFTLGEVDGERGRLVSYDEREVPFDLAVVVPLHGGAEYVEHSEGLGDELGFVPVDPHTLQLPGRPEVFAIGDAAGLPASKAGSVAHFEGEVLVHNIARHLAGQPLDASFDGHANCFVETGFHKALLIDFNYDTEPLPGHFPGPLGLPLLKESHASHLGKLAFEWLYWHSLLPGRELPGIGSAMPEHGKNRVSA